ncbi:uncharacterized protein LOC130438799 [Triplophysa dalaica]|uniref:uncharacterized protein LOC130438799 n=1 Tax=Triplophysa dalaica TaxID=1582913 RepID=UPI0024DFADB7|nr:uncharacterized protein LOC130438799 [Triplophysa dalaica]
MIYVNNNGLLSFSQPIAEMEPLSFSSYGEDLIAPLWTDLDDFGFGIVYYQEYTSGNVLTRATEDIKSYYPGLSFNANWVFVATWDFVQIWDENGFYQHAAPIISFQVVLISDGSHSFILMNYGDISTFGREAEAGYGTIGSTHYFVIPGSNDLYHVSNLKYTSNVHVQGRWAFSANQGLVQFAETFYPVGLAAGDTQTIITDDIYLSVALSRPFVYFGRTYHLIYVNNNGLLSFSQPIPEMDPSYGGEDLIAPLWSDLDDFGLIALNYQEYTSGDVLTRATQDINQYYPGLNFNATWVFVATWDLVNTWDTNVLLHHSAPSVSVQVVLISNGSHSFILMNYGDIAPQFYSVKAGYDTVGSLRYFVIPGSNDWNLAQNLKNTSNVHVPGRWAFMAYTENVVGLQMTVTSYLDLIDAGNLAVVLEQIKHELVIRGLSSDVQLSARRVKKNP